MLVSIGAVRFEHGGALGLDELRFQRNHHAIVSRFYQYRRDGTVVIGSSSILMVFVVNNERVE